MTSTATATGPSWGHIHGDHDWAWVLGPGDFFLPGVLRIQLCGASARLDTSILRYTDHGGPLLRWDLGIRSGLPR